MALGAARGDLMNVPRQSGTREVALPTSAVLSLPIAAVSMADAIARVNCWVATSSVARLVAFSNVHMLVEAQIHPELHRVLSSFDMLCPDGAPVFWILRRRVGRRVAKISGPDFMPLFCEQSVELNHRHFLYGGAPGVAEKTAEALRQSYPGLQIAGHYCPPFRDLDAEERGAVISQINASGANVVWVCLGCPKQEYWLNETRDLLDARVVLAVGQAFDIVAGCKKRAPTLFRAMGAEWFYRLLQEPRRLWKRYLVTNLLFLLLLMKNQLESRSDHSSIQ